MLPLDADPRTFSKSGLGSVKGPLDAKFWETACLRFFINGAFGC